MTPAVEQFLASSRATGADPLRTIYRLEPLFAAAALLFAAPALLVIAAIISLLCRRTPLVRHRRVGWHGAELPMLKLRTMWEPKPAWAGVFTIEEISDTVPVTKQKADARVSSPFAAWCRRYSIDEIPQLYHVVRGQMSLVGPRPITRAEWEEHYGRSSQTVLTLRPGLTGLWQVMGRNRCSYAQRRRLDLWLSRHASPGLYFHILLRSIPGVLQGHGAY